MVDRKTVRLGLFLGPVAHETVSGNTRKEPLAGAESAALGGLVECPSKKGDHGAVIYTASPGRAPARWLWMFVAGCVLAVAFGLITLATDGAPVRLTVEGIGDGPVAPGPNGSGVSDGGVAGTGRFRFGGVFNGAGRFTDYRTVTGQIATVRKVLVTSEGTVTMMVTIHLGREGSPSWTITAATGAYAGLRGKGTLTVDNFQVNPYTFAMAGTISR
jgi:hypothetical protein